MGVVSRTWALPQTQGTPSSPCPCKHQINNLFDVLRLVSSSPAPLIRGNKCCSVQ